MAEPIGVILSNYAMDQERKVYWKEIETLGSTPEKPAAKKPAKG